MKAEQLTGGLLDYWVAKSLAKDGDWRQAYYGNARIVHGVCYLNDERESRYTPSDNWCQGGPIIEREEMSIERTFFPKGYEVRNNRNAFSRGKTILEAAMRCYVASVFGSEFSDIEE